MTGSITLPANAKLNLYLNILNKREDGYHNIITEMQEIDLCDTVSVAVYDGGSSGERIVIECDNHDIPCDNRNIAYKAAELFLNTVNDNQSCVSVNIRKRIPLMAGLGGSSTDGAAVFKCLNIIFDNVFSDKELCYLGAKISADLPFFIIGGRAKCEGIGDIITPLPPFEKQCYYVIVQPPFYCDTKAAYAKFADFSGTYNGGNIFQQLYNDERIEKACDDLRGLGAKTAMMSGSGSAVFGVFCEYATAEKAFSALDYKVKYVVRSVET